jgi:hypothetical protein
MCATKPRHTGQNQLEIWQRWFLFGFHGIQNAILGPYILYNADDGVETMGTSKVQTRRLVDHPKPSMDGA